MVVAWKITKSTHYTILYFTTLTKNNLTLVLVLIFAGSLESLNDFTRDIVNITYIFYLKITSKHKLHSLSYYRWKHFHAFML